MTAALVAYLDGPWARDEPVGLVHWLEAPPRP
jgi:hypothetical protein